MASKDFRPRPYWSSPLVGAEVVSKEFLGWCDMSAGFSAAGSRARGKKLGVSERQLAGGGFPVNGNFNHAPGTTVLVHTFYIGVRSKTYGMMVRASRRLTASRTNPAAVG